MKRFFLTLLLIIGGVPLAVVAQEGECVVPQKDMPVAVSDTQGLILRVSGGAQMLNASIRPSDLPVVTSGSARVRSTPSSDGSANVFTVIASSQPLRVLGRTEAGDWLYIVAPENPRGDAAGWVEAGVVTVVGDASMLPVISAENPPSVLAPFQAVTVPPETCIASDIAGGLIQSTGAEFVLAVVNGVEILVDGTVFVRPVEETLTVSVIDGRAMAGGQFIPAGAAVDIAPDAETDAPLPYDSAVLAGLPLDTAANSPFEAVRLTPALAPEDVYPAALVAFAPSGLIDGLYDVSVTEFVETKPDTYGSGYCFSRGESLTDVVVEDGRIVGMDATPTIFSMTEFTFKNSVEDDKTGCRATHAATWVSP